MHFKAITLHFNIVISTIVVNELHCSAELNLFIITVLITVVMKVFPWLHTSAHDQTVLQLL